MSKKPLLGNAATLGGATTRPAELALARQGSLPGEQLRDVDPAQLLARPAPAQVREDDDPDAEDFVALVESIAERGVLEPVLARETPTGLELIAGHRRVRAALAAPAMRAKLNLPPLPVRVPVRILNVSDSDAAAITAVENLARKDLRPWETMRALATLRDAYKAAGRPTTIAALRTASGYAAGSLSTALRVVDALAPAGAVVVPEASVQSLNALTWDQLATAGLAPDPAAALRLALFPPAPDPLPDPSLTLDRVGDARGREVAMQPLPPAGGTWTLRLTANGRGAPTVEARGPAGGKWRTPDALSPADARELLPQLERLVKALKTKTTTRGTR